MRAVLISAAMAASACAGAPPTQPTAPDPPAVISRAPVTITAAVAEFGTERPIPHARVFIDSIMIGRTGDDGVVLVQAISGRALTMYATADGYERSLTAVGTPYSSERWTFYLHPEPAGD